MLQKLILMAGVLVVLLGISEQGYSQECTANCNGGDVTVDLAAECMCLGQGKCFKVAIGKDGPTMTTSGNGTIGDANGAKYQTTQGPGTTGYDRDALAMGIPGNDAVGKWIHKTSGCGPGGGRQTLGCIAVPCDKWPDVKAMKGKSISVCGGNQDNGTTGADGRPVQRNSAESNDIQDGDLDFTESTNTRR